MSVSRKKSHILKIKVHPVVYDFYFAQYDGDTFDLKDDSVLSIVVPHILTLKPKDYKLERLANYKQLNVIVHDMIIGAGSDCAKYIHAEHRHYTSDRNQYYVSRFLDGIVKNIFHNYMLAYMRSNKKAQQKDAILDFCMVYRIEENAINYEMLKKSWDRSGEKKEWQRLVLKNVKEDKIKC
jgi:hypothetical protein